LRTFPEICPPLNILVLQNSSKVSHRRRVTTLLLKDVSKLLELSNWHPITVLKVESKIASKAVASRIKEVLLSLLHCDQSGFMTDKFIGQNIRLTNDILEQTE